MSGPFKMKGSPMQRNFGIGGSPMRDETSTWDKVKAATSAVTSSLGKVNPVGYPLSERISDKYKAKKKEYREKKAASPAKQKDTHPEKRKTTTKTQKTFKETENERIRGEKYIGKRSKGGLKPLTDKHKGKKNPYIKKY